MNSFMDNIKRVDPYIPGEQPQGNNIIKLNTNENPYPPSPPVIEALRSFDAGRLNLYPDPTSDILVSALSSYHGVDKKQIFVGIGSDDVLAMSFLTFFNSKKNPVVFPDITYSFYPVWARVYGIPYVEIPLLEDFTIDPHDYMESCIKDSGLPFGGIVIANPNAPTGISLGLSDIKNILSANRTCVVIIDEAYVDFGGESALPLIDEFENLIITRTYSKSRSMAGERIGYAIGSKELIQCLNDVAQSVNSYTLTGESLVLGTASLKDDEYFKARINDIIKTRENTVKELKKRGFSLTDSSANFVFAKPEGIPAKTLFEKLRKMNVYVRYFKSPRTKDYLRITIGTDEQMRALFSAIDEILS